MKKKIVLCMMAFIGVLNSVSAQVALKSEGLAADYVNNIVNRSQKIVDKLNISDTRKAEAVRNIIANRYFSVNKIHEDFKDNKDQLNAELYKHHYEMEFDLSCYLDAAGVEAVKDGMTFGVVNNTSRAYYDMIPTLKESEKLRIRNWLKEAREFALDAPSSKEKHACFKKYKGRINNWLATQGYDMKKEREAWMKRVEEAKKKKK